MKIRIIDVDPATYYWRCTNLCAVGQVCRAEGVRTWGALISRFGLPYSALYALSDVAKPRGEPLEKQLGRFNAEAAKMGLSWRLRVKAPTGVPPIQEQKHGEPPAVERSPSLTANQG